MGCFQFSITCEKKYARINYETSQVLISVYDIQLNCFPVSQVLICTSVPIDCCSYSLKKIHMGDSHDWRPFIYGGFSSCTAEFGIIDSHFSCVYINIIVFYYFQVHSQLILPKQGFRFKARSWMEDLQLFATMACFTHCQESPGKKVSGLCIQGMSRVHLFCFISAIFLIFLFQHLASTFKTIHIWNYQVWDLLYPQKVDWSSWSWRHDDKHILWCYCWCGFKCHSQSNRCIESKDASMLNLPAAKVNVWVLWRCIQTRRNIWFVAGMQYVIL